MVAQGLGEEEGAFLLGEEKYFKFNVGDCCTTLWVYWKTLNCILWMSELYDMWITTQ